DSVMSGYAQSPPRFVVSPAKWAFPGASSGVDCRRSTLIRGLGRSAGVGIEHGPDGPLGQAARCPRTHPHSPGRPDRSGPTVRWPAATGVLRDARNPHRIVKILWCGARGTRFIGDSQGFLTRQIAKMPDFSVFYPLMKKSKNHSAKGCAAGR